MLWQGDDWKFFSNIHIIIHRRKISAFIRFPYIYMMRQSTGWSIINGDDTIPPTYLKY